MFPRPDTYIVCKQTGDALLVKEIRDAAARLQEKIEEAAKSGIIIEMEVVTVGVLGEVSRPRIIEIRASKPIE